VELDDVIDAMIADRVIHRHRRKWLIALAVLVVLALIILALGGWEEKKGRQVPEVQAPATIDTGRFEIQITGAKIIHKPKKEFSEAETRVEVALDIRNIDEETKTSASVSDNLLRLVTGKDVIESNGASCNGELNYKLVFGLPAVHCTSKFEVPAGFSNTAIEVGVIGEEFKPSDLLGSTDEPYWQDGEAIAVVQMTGTEETETG
jgi:hypothetical protein